MASTPVLIQTPKWAPTTTFASTYTPNTVQTLYTAGASGSKLVSAVGLSTDTVARVLQLWITRSATAYLIGSFSIPAASGNDGSTPTANLLGLNAGMPRDNDGQVYLFMQSGDVLGASLTAAPAAGKFVYAWSMGADF
jgi:hypothetical protein